MSREYFERGIILQHLFWESKSGADAPPVVLRTLLLYARRRIVYTTFGLNVLLIILLACSPAGACGACGPALFLLLLVFASRAGKNEQQKNVLGGLRPPNLLAGSLPAVSLIYDMLGIRACKGGWNVTLLSYTNKYYRGVESVQGIYCVFPPHFPQNVDNRLVG